MTDSIDQSVFNSTSSPTPGLPTRERHIPTPTNDVSTGSDMKGGTFNDDLEQERDWYCFTTPECPSGVELVLNILTTWGDRFYVGLTGIEVYSSNGKPATIAQVHKSSAVGPVHCIACTSRYNKNISMWCCIAGRNLIFTEGHLTAKISRSGFCRWTFPELRMYI